MAARTANGTCVEVQTVRSPPMGRPPRARARVSSGIPANARIREARAHDHVGLGEARAVSPVAPALTPPRCRPSSMHGARQAQRLRLHRHRAGSASYSITTRSTASAAT
jgi:hypothetical protein